MIVVTGFRSGTSLIMQTLKLLEFPIVGYKFHDDFSHKELNPKGYYSLPGRETVYGLKTHYKGKAVKLGGAELFQTNHDFVKKIIVCERDRHQTVNSIVKLLKADYDIAEIEPTVENAELVFDININFQERAIRKFNKPIIRIRYEDITTNPEVSIKKIKEFLGLRSNINNAILNINTGKTLCQSLL